LTLPVDCWERKEKGVTFVFHSNKKVRGGIKLMARREGANDGLFVWQKRNKRGEGASKYAFGK